MSENTEFRGYCPVCDREVEGEQRPVSHKQQFWLSVFTLGCWLPIWVMLSVLPRDVTCAHCGIALVNVRPAGKPNGKK